MKRITAIMGLLLTLSLAVACAPASEGENSVAQPVDEGNATVLVYASPL